MGKVLCIDDIPNELIIGSNKSLKDTIVDIFRDPPYEVIFSKSGAEGLEIVRQDPDIELVLLDIQFNGQEMQGSKIADNLFKINPSLRVIVLTKEEGTGEKRSFGWKRNIIGYIIKKNIANPANMTLLKNLAYAVIDDPKNEKWTMALDTDRKKVSLIKGGESYSFSIPRSQRKWQLIAACAANPNECIESIDIEDYATKSDEVDASIHREVYEINHKVLKTTQWRTWGILDTHCGTESSARLIIGKVRIDEEKIPTFKSTVKQQGLMITAEQFEEYKKYIESRFEKIKEELLSLEKR